jgi:hypothetical protein
MALNTVQKSFITLVPDVEAPNDVNKGWEVGDEAESLQWHHDSQIEWIHCVSLFKMIVTEERKTALFKRSLLKVDKK